MNGKTPWMKHLTEVYKENKAKNPDYKFSAAMKDAKKSYRGGSATKEATVGGGNSIIDNAAPVSGGMPKEGAAASEMTGGAASIADTAAPVSGGMPKEGAAASEMTGGKRRRRRSGKRKSSKRRSGKRKSSKRKSSKRRR